MKYFKLQEIVPPETYQNMGELAWGLFDPTILAKLDTLRDRWDKPLLINNGTNLRYCGYRPKEYKGGAPKSMHRQGLAFDLHSNDLTGLTKFVIDNYKTLGVSRIEDPQCTPTWLHVEFSTKPVNELKIFKP